MYTPTRSFSGNRLKRIFGFSALFLGTTTGVVMAANPGCQIALHWEAGQAQTAVARKVHHSAATLARWKAGALVWSKAHHGQVYTGHPSVQAAMVWRPLTYRCGDIALATDFAAPLIPDEAPPEFNAYASAFPSAAPLLDIASVQDVPLEEVLLAPVYGTSTAGTGGSSGANAPVNGPVGPPSLASVGSEPTAGHLRLLPPKHPPQEVTLLPQPLPPTTIVPTPEPSTMILLSTGLATLGLGGARISGLFRKLKWRDR